MQLSNEANVKDMELIHQIESTAEESTKSVVRAN